MLDPSLVIIALIGLVIVLLIALVSNNHRTPYHPFGNYPPYDYRPPRRPVLYDYHDHPYYTGQQDYMQPRYIPYDWDVTPPPYPQPANNWIGLIILITAIALMALASI
ncbi:MAG: hypothetical protein ACOYNO_02330 [Saprospiraceae bacterium]